MAAAAGAGAPGSTAPAVPAGTPGSGGTAPASQGVLIGDRLYSGVLITLENCLLPDDKLRFTPSMSSGLDTDTETDLRVVGCELIQAAGPLPGSQPHSLLTSGTLLLSLTRRPPRTQPLPRSVSPPGTWTQRLPKAGAPLLQPTRGDKGGEVAGCEEPLWMQKTF